MVLRHPILTLLTLAYLGFVGWVTLGPAPFDANTATLVVRVVRYLHSHGLPMVTYSHVEFCANIAMFVPIGALFVLLFGRRQWWLALLLGVLLTCCIETAQALWLPTRVADIRDVISNSTGALIGVLAIEIVTWPKARRIRRARSAHPQIAR